MISFSQTSVAGVTHFINVIKQPRLLIKLPFEADDVFPSVHEPRASPTPSQAALLVAPFLTALFLFCQDIPARLFLHFSNSFSTKDSLSQKSSVSTFLSVLENISEQNTHFFDAC